MDSNWTLNRKKGMEEDTWRSSVASATTSSRQSTTNCMHGVMALLKQLASKFTLCLNFPEDIETDDKVSNPDNSPRKCHDKYYNVEDEAKRLKNEMEITIEEVKKSKFYRDITCQLRKNSKLRKHIWRILKYDESEQMQIVIYCLGSMEFGFRSQYQLALSILLKKEFFDRICSSDTKIDAFDPKFTPADRIVLEELGVKVLTNNEHCRRRVLRPTLFIMPFYSYKCMENLLEENWQPCHLNKMILLSNSLNFRLAQLLKKRNDYNKDNDYDNDNNDDQDNDSDDNNDNNDKDDNDHVDLDEFCRWPLENMPCYSKAIHDRSSEFLLPRHCFPFWNMFRNFAWHFFDLDPHLNLDTLLPAVIPSKEKRMEAAKAGDALEDLDEYDHLEKLKIVEESFMEAFENKKQNTESNVSDQSSDESNGKSTRYDWFYSEYRGPRWIRLCSLPPQPGWHKLNITGIGHSNINKYAYFGGVLADDKGEVVAKYSGNLGRGKDKTVAVAEALELGAMLVSKKFSGVITKLVLEGNDVSFIRWVNKGPEPPKNIQKHLANVNQNWLKEVVTVVYHVYDEANSLAIEMANQGSKVGANQAWIYTKSGGEEIMDLE